MANAAICLLHTQAISGKLLAQAEGDGVLHVGAARLHNVVKLFSLGFESRRERFENRIELFQFQQGGQAHAGRKDIIGRLAVIHVVIGMDDVVVAEFAAQNLDGAIGDDLVGVHVKADTGAGLEDVDYELMVPFAFHNFLRGANHGISPFVFNQAERLVGFRRRLFHHAKGLDQRGMGLHAGDGIIFYSAKRLDSVIDVRWNFLGANRVLFYAQVLRCSCHDLPRELL